MSLAIINYSFAAVLLGGAIYFWRKTSQLKIDKPAANPSVTRTLLSVQVPKNNDRTPIAAEQMFAALHGIFRSGSDIQSSVSFEIVAKNQQINFYIYTPTELKDFVLSQVYAQYPNVEMTEVPLDQDYADPTDSQHLAMTELTMKKPTAYPIKTFQNFEVDPLSALTGVLSSAGTSEELWTQLIVRPIDDDWQEQGDKEIKNIKEPPKKMDSFVSAVGGELKKFITHGVPYAITHQIPEEKKEEKKDAKELTGPVQQAVKGIEEKITKLGFEVTIRLVAVSTDPYAAKAKLEQLIGAYKQYNALNINSFISKDIVTDRQVLNLYQSREIGNPEIIFNITELASLYHFPSETVATPTINWAGSRKGEPPGNLPVLGTVPSDELTVFAQTNFRNQIQKFGIKKGDRRLHTYIIGKTGTGKSTLIENMIYDDIREGRGVAVVDPHGQLIDHVLDFIPDARVKDVVYFNPADSDNPIGFNLLENVSPDLKNVVASGVVGIFKKIFGESWGPRLEYILRNAILGLLDYPSSTLLGVMRILTDNSFRRLVVNTIKDPVIRDFFVNEYEKYEPKFRNEAIAPIQNKVGQFLSSSTIRNIVGQPTSTMNINEIMDHGKILLADLSTGKIGEDNSALLGSMLITKIQLAAMDRVNIKEDDRRDFYLYVDEFQNFATESFAVILSEARKYHLNLVMINQYITQMPETVANAVFGNVGTMIAFRVGAADAEVLKREFEPIFDVNDLVNLPNWQIYLKMAIDGVTVPAFSANTLAPPSDKSNLAAEVVAASREQFSRPRSDVEEYIADWSAPVNLAEMEARKNVEVGESKEKIEAKPAEQPAAAEVQSGGEVPEKNGEEAAPKDIEQGRKIEILKDRFDRQWYAVSSKGEGESQPNPEVSEVAQHIEEPATQNEPVVQEENVPENTGTNLQSGGVGSEEEPLISWDKADELGLSLGQTVKTDTKASDEFEPIDEL
ncbi:MAG TPA: type IV secretion system DNA-binding domain-containing protein [Candidatus Saccharimonadales bacterium]|nr:type IV secretion system DNA-binding domain-containing protein [Candidatus Saccharimonadales bacterium]